MDGTESGGHMHYRQPRQEGFFLIEAMLSFLVMSFGILALAGMQIKLSNDADVAKQRIEAMRLAQKRMETMRAFTHIAPVYPAAPGPPAVVPSPIDPDRDGVKRLAWNELASGSDSNNPLVATGYSNTSFERSWTVNGAVTDAMRGVNVKVAWRDRNGEPQEVSLDSVISQSDPLNANALGFPLPANTNLKLPKNRSLNVPVPSVSLSNGKSAFQVSNNFAVVFSDVTGSVVEKCNTNVTAASYSSGTAGCTTYSAYIVAGYVSGAITNSALFQPTRPTGINTTAVTFNNSDGRSISCSYAVAQDQSTGLVLPSSHYYLCVIPVSATDGRWSGTVRLGGVPTSDNYKVCRFEYAGQASDSTDMKNSRNVQPYVNVSESLDNQNYHVENSNSNSCPVVSGLQTVLHQNCRSAGGQAATECPATAADTPAS